MAELQRSEVLCVPKRRKLAHSKLTSAEGQEVLHLFYGEKEIIFDEPELVPFGDKLLEAERFRAEEAMAWSSGEPHAWERVRELLEALLAEEILKRVAEANATPRAQTFPATLGPPREAQEPRTFSAHHDRCPVLTKEAFGRAIDLSNLEAVVPVYRVAHPVLDRDGRQVGENNVTPRSLFLDLPTQRRLCNYAGDRYQADAPTNVTALKHMTSRWPELLSLTEQSRAAFVGRFPRREPAFTAGDMQLLSACTLASVGYVMVRGVDPVPNGQLDAGLAAMFRLIDGVRLVTTDMIRATAGEQGCGRIVTAQGIADYAERNGIYHGTYGVCAGPQALIDEYLRVLVGDVRAPIEVEPDLASRVGDLAAALDYGLFGQRIESLIRICGSSQGLLHERLKAAFADRAPRTKIHELLEDPIDSEHYSMLREVHPRRETLELEIAVSRWLFERAGEALSGDVRVCRAPVDALLKLEPASQTRSRLRLAELFAAALPGLAEQLAGELAAVAAEAFALERRCLRAVGAEQRELNARLKRASGPALTSADLAVYNRPRTGPPFESTLAEGLGLTITTDAATTVLSYGDHRLSLTD